MLNSLYQERIIDLAKRARLRGRLGAPDASARVDNPLCGDRVVIDLAIEHHKITAIGHRVRGCALCEAASEIIASSAPGMTIPEVAAVESAMRTYLKSRGDVPPAWGELSVFEPVRTVPSRHECVLLPFSAVRQAAGPSTGLNEASQRNGHDERRRRYPDNRSP